MVPVLGNKGSWVGKMGRPWQITHFGRGSAPPRRPRTPRKCTLRVKDDVKNKTWEKIELQVAQMTPIVVWLGVISGVPLGRNQISNRPRIARITRIGPDQELNGVVRVLWGKTRDYSTYRHRAGNTPVAHGSASSPNKLANPGTGHAYARARDVRSARTVSSAR